MRGRRAAAPPRLYGRGLEVRLERPEAVIAATNGVTASFMKELVRKAALTAALRDGDGALGISDDDLDTALRELLEEGSALTKVLLGAGPGRPGTEWLSGPDAGA